MDLRPMELKDTASMMLSEDYKERFQAEYGQLRLRYLDKWDQGMMDFEPACPRSIYNMQIRAMEDYIAVLEARAVMEDIIL